MALTNYNNGISSFGVPVIPGIPYPVTGKVFFVHSGTGSNGNKGTAPARPFATLDYAIGQCTASKGDVILIMPGHSETITGAGGITADVAGIAILGLGRGNDRPTFLMDGATTVSFVVSAASVTVRNCVFKAGHADIVTCFAITGAHAWIDACEFVNNVVDENFLTEIKHTSTTDNAGDGLKVTGCRVNTIDASAVEFIEINADIDGLVVTDNFVSKDAGTAAGFIVVATGKDLRACQIERNRLLSGATSGDLFIDNDTAVNSGIVAFNAIGHHDVAAAVPTDCDGVRLIENYAVGVDTGSALLLPAVDDNA